MSESQQSPAVENGPYLQVAAFCENALTEKDGTISLIRVVDRLTFQIQSSGQSPNATAFNISITAVISLKSGEARGTHDLSIEAEAPSGLHMGQPVHLPVFLEGEDRGATLILPVAMEAHEEGLYWFSIRFDNVLLTRMPLRVLVLRVSVAGPRSSGPG